MQTWSGTLHLPHARYRTTYLTSSVHPTSRYGQPLHQEGPPGLRPAPQFVPDSHLTAACELMARISRDARIARNRPQEATCIESTSGRSSLACMLGTQMTMGRQTRRVRTTRALWFWWSGIGTQPFHELAHTHTTLHHHLATRRTHAHAQKILATHGCEGLTLHT